MISESGNSCSEINNFYFKMIRVTHKTPRITKLHNTSITFFPFLFEIFSFGKQVPKYIPNITNIICYCSFSFWKPNRVKWFNNHQFWYVSQICIFRERKMKKLLPDLFAWPAPRCRWAWCTLSDCCPALCTHLQPGPLVGKKTFVPRAFFQGTFF